MENNFIELKEVLKPEHYKSGEFDVIAFCMHHKLSFSEGNVIKYITRAGKKSKNKIEDYEKAKEYIDRMIQREKGV